MNKLTLAALLITSLIALPAAAQQPDKEAAPAKTAKLKQSPALNGLRAEQAAFAPASAALTPPARPKGDKADVVILTETFPGSKMLGARRERARKIAALAADLRREAAAAKADASALRAIDGLIADARVVEAGVTKLIGHDGKLPGQLSREALTASDAHAARLRDSLAATLGLLEPVIMR